MATVLQLVRVRPGIATALRKTVLPSYRYIHFSTHAYTDPQHPEATGLVLSLADRAGREQEGILRLPAILNLGLRSDLVVLSACETALGREVSTEGVIGVTQAFLYAGAQRVVSSLWPVDEFRARQFMVQFYEGILKRGMPPAQALRAAQLQMARTRLGSPPSVWAAFELYGLPD